VTDEQVTSTIQMDRPGNLALLAGKVVTLGHKLLGHHNYDAYRLEFVQGLPLLVLPTVSNPRILRSGAFFASTLARSSILEDASVLDLGTGSGVCAVIAAQQSRSVIATDINPIAIQCAQINASINELEDRIEFRRGDLFDPVRDVKFDLILFNPPFYLGTPADARDSAWRGSGLAERFAEELAMHLNQQGAALLLLSTMGNASAVFEAQLRARGFRLDRFARKRYLNEVLTVFRVTPQPKAGKST
jgi:release factor glutamine methyltransferase